MPSEESRIKRLREWANRALLRQPGASIIERTVAEDVQHLEAKYQRDLAAEKRAQELLAIRVLGQAAYDNSPCQAHPFELIEQAFAAERERLREDAEMKLPCGVTLDRGTHIGKGCSMSTLVLALKNRARYEEEDSIDAARKP